MAGLNGRKGISDILFFILAVIVSALILFYAAREFGLLNGG